MKDKIAFIQGPVEKIYIWAVRRRPSIIIAQEGVLRDYLYSIHLIHTLPRPPPPNSRRNGGWPEEASCCALLSYFSKISESIIYHYSEKHGPTSEKVTARKRSKIMLTESSFLSHFIRDSLSFVVYFLKWLIQTLQRHHQSYFGTGWATFVSGTLNVQQHYCHQPFFSQDGLLSFAYPCFKCSFCW